MYYALHLHGLQVESMVLRGLFSKNRRPKGYKELWTVRSISTARIRFSPGMIYRSFDFDPMLRIKRRRDRFLG
jgi:hypothetical protein